MLQGLQQDYTWLALSSAAELQKQQPIFAGIASPGQLTFTVQLDKIPCTHKHFELARPIDLQFAQDDGFWSCDAFGIVSLGSTPEEAALSFCEDFTVFWDEIALAPDDSLSAGAQKTKQGMLSVVKSVR